MLDYDLLNKNVYLVPLVFSSVALVLGFIRLLTHTP